MNGGGWSGADIIHLTHLWNQTAPELSTSKIAEIMGRSKNSVVGKAHRLNLTMRPSPIIRDEATRERRAASPSRSGKKQTLPAIEAASIRPNFAERVPQRAPERPAPEPVVPAAHRGPCRFPMWGHQERAPIPPRFCCAPCRPVTEGGGSYCAEHAAICFQAVDLSRRRAPTLNGVARSALSVSVKRDADEPAPLTGEME